MQSFRLQKFCSQTVTLTSFVHVKSVLPLPLLSLSFFLSLLRKYTIWYVTWVHNHSDFYRFHNHSDFYCFPASTGPIIIYVFDNQRGSCLAKSEHKLNKACRTYTELAGNSSSKYTRIRWKVVTNSRWSFLFSWTAEFFSSVSLVMSALAWNHKSR